MLHTSKIYEKLEWSHILSATILLYFLSLTIIFSNDFILGVFLNILISIDIFLFVNITYKKCSNVLYDYKYDNYSKFKLKTHINMLEITSKTMKIFTTINMILFIFLIIKYTIYNGPHMYSFPLFVYCIIDIAIVSINIIKLEDIFTTRNYWVDRKITPLRYIKKLAEGD